MAAALDSRSSLRTDDTPWAAQDPRLEVTALGDKLKVISLVVALVAVTFFYAFPNALVFAIFLTAGYVAYEMNSVGNNLHDVAANNPALLSVRQAQTMNEQQSNAFINHVTKNTIIAKYFGNRLLQNHLQRI